VPCGHEIVSKIDGEEFEDVGELAGGMLLIKVAVNITGAVESKLIPLPIIYSVQVRKSSV
jgi:hypothetical protein